MLFGLYGDGYLDNDFNFLINDLYGVNGYIIKIKGDSEMSNIKKECEHCGKKTILLQNSKTGNYVEVLISELTIAERIDIENEPLIELMFNPMHHNNHHAHRDATSGQDLVEEHTLKNHEHYSLHCIQPA